MSISTYMPWLSRPQYDPVARTCVCPAGKFLNSEGVRQYHARVCVGTIPRNEAGLRGVWVAGRCLRDPMQATPRQVAFFRGRATSAPQTHTARMKRRIDQPHERARYGRRFATVEPVFA